MDQTPVFGLENISDNVWPQRLLRIKDMTSYELNRQGNDAYYRKKDKNPEYAIVSYTWGRFRADGKWGSPNDPKAEAISVKGIDWSIPAIDPKNGFSRDKFKRTLQAVAGNYNYVWLDVACINQEADPDPYNQIGCQAAIFKRASASYIWLHQQGWKGEPTLESLVNALIESIQTKPIDQSQLTREENKSAVAQRQKLEHDVCSLLHDPWFSSLWTLQESYLRKDATILTRPGDKTTITFDGNQRVLTLQLLLEICHSYLNSAHLNQHIVQPIKKAGLDLLVGYNPLVLLRAARHRTSTHMKDRIIAIQQIFGVNIEQSVVDHREMEMILSLEINKRCPALAQAFYHPYESQNGSPYWKAKLGTFVEPKIYSSNPERIRTGRSAGQNMRRGRINGTTAGIEDTMTVPEDFLDAQEIQCRYRARLSAESNSPLRWEGFSFPLERLREMWTTYEQDRMPPGLANGDMSGPNGFVNDIETRFRNDFNCSMYLDSVSWVSQKEPPVNILPANFMQYTSPLTTVYQLCNNRPNMIRVLILGKIQTITEDQRTEAWVGLLVKQGRQTGFYDRIGFCTWNNEISSVDQHSCLLG